MKIYIISKNNIKNHIPNRLLNNPRTLTCEISIIVINKINNRPVRINVDDQEFTFKKMQTKSKIIIKILFLGSSLWTKLLYGAYLPNVK